MNSSADSRNTRSTANRKRKAKAMIAVQSKRTKFLQKYRRQAFTLPDSIMHYIAKNPSSSKVYGKMVQTCKYFFMKNPILLVSECSYQHGWKALYNEKRTNIDLDKITSKLWIIDSLLVAHQTANHLASTILSKIYQYHAIILSLHDQHLSYNEVMILGSEVKYVEFHKVIVKYQDGSIVPFEKIFEAFPRVKNIEFFATPSVSTITAKTFTELLKIPHFSTLEYCMLQNIPDAFDIESFYVYMKKNQRTSFQLYFYHSISAAYSNRLEQIVDEILTTVNHNYKTPFIGFSAIDFTKLGKLFSLSSQ